jgi:hypothetical protein
MPREIGHKNKSAIQNTDQDEVLALIVIIYPLGQPLNTATELLR